MIKLNTTAIFYNIITIRNHSEQYMQLTETYKTKVALNESNIQLRRLDYRGHLFVKLDNDPKLYQVNKTTKGVNPQYIQLELAECKNMDITSVVNGGDVDGGRN